VAATLYQPFERIMRVAYLIFAVQALALAPPAAAQVLEITRDGVKVHDRPEAVTPEGTTVIATGSAVRIKSTLARSAAGRTVSASTYLSASDVAGLSAELIEAVAWQESRGRLGLRSPKGARGPMQLMPGTAVRLRVNADDERSNVHGGARYLKMMMDRYHGDLIKALAAYDSGPKSVDRFGGVPPFKETQAYVAAVLERLSAISLAGKATERK